MLRDSRLLVSDCNTLYLTDQLKEHYKIRYDKHEIHIVEGKKVILKEMPLKEFAVQLRIVHHLSTVTEFSDEMRMYLENLKASTGDNVKISELVDHTDRVTFVRGIAGMGKSVLAKQLTILWAKGDLDDKFRCCIMVECREINHYHTTKRNDGKTHEIFENFLKENFNYDLGDGEGILFVVDGLDELFDINEDDSIIGQLLNMSLSKYSRSKIIITGRPHIEKKLRKHGKQHMGGLREVEIQGLSERQIDDYICKFPSLQADSSFIKKSKESSACNLSILHCPQFLNTFCCVAILKEGKALENEAELYPWMIYLLLRQHGARYPNESRFPKCFEKYSELLRFLSNICHELLTENKIIIERKIKKDIKERIPGIEADKENFIKSLFVDVSDNQIEAYPFKHLSLMEFLAALHICSKGEELMDTVKKYLEKGFIDVVTFVCRLIAGLSSSAIIKEILEKVSNLQTIDTKSFLKKLLAVLKESRLDNDTKFKRYIDFIAYFLTEDFQHKDAILSMTSSIEYEIAFLKDTSDAILLNSIAHICKHLDEVCSCNGDEIRRAFNKFSIKELDIQDLQRIESVKYLNIEWIVLRLIKTDLITVRSNLEKGIFGGCRRLSLVDCQLMGINSTEQEGGGQSYALSLMGLGITRCSMTMESFNDICELGMSSESFYLRGLEIGCDWWMVLAKKVAERNTNGSLLLKKLGIESCSSSMTMETGNWVC